MAAILRVKRRRTDDPAESLVISSKRTKNDPENKEAESKEQDSVNNVFKFAGTLDKKDGHVGQHVRDAIRKAKLQREVLKQHQQPVGALASKVRAEHSKASSDARYKVIAQKRSLNLDSLDTPDESAEAPSSDGLSKKTFCLYDLVDDLEKEIEEEKEPAAPETITCNGVSLVREPVPVETEKDCVYDLYYINDPQFDFQSLEHILAIEARREEEYIDERAEEVDEQVYDDEDDADAEDNWRNDYPDEEPRHPRRMGSEDDSDEEEGDDYRDPFDSDDDEYYAQMLEDKLVIGEDCVEGALSSSDEDDGFVYYKEPSEQQQAMSSYEKYKARVTKELEAVEDKGEEEVEEEDEDTETEM